MDSNISYNHGQNEIHGTPWLVIIHCLGLLKKMVLNLIIGDIEEKLIFFISISRKFDVILSNSKIFPFFYLLAIHFLTINRNDITANN